MMRMFAYVLVAAHLFLVLWALGGFIEFFAPTVFWERFSNTLFPRWLLFVYWSSVLFSGAIFLYGYFTHWQKTPSVMVGAYSLLTILCAVETLWFMTSSTRFFMFSIELTTYVVILAILLKAPHFLRHFRREV